MGAHFEALIEGVLMAPMDSRYTQVGLNLISVQVCMDLLWSDVGLALSAEHVSRDERGDGVEAAARPTGVGDPHRVTVAAPAATRIIAAGTGGGNNDPSYIQ